MAYSQTWSRTVTSAKDQGTRKTRGQSTSSAILLITETKSPFKGGPIATESSGNGMVGVRQAFCAPKNNWCPQKSPKTTQNLILYMLPRDCRVQYTESCVPMLRSRIASPFSPSTNSNNIRRSYPTQQAQTPSKSPRSLCVLRLGVKASARRVSSVSSILTAACACRRR